MNLYYSLHYLIYRFYEKRGDDISYVYSFCIPVLLISFNMFTVIFVVDIMKLDSTIEFTKTHVVIMYSVLGLFNYLTLYHNKKYEEVFAEFTKDDEHYKTWKRITYSYMIVTVVALGVALVIFEPPVHR